MLHTIGLLLPTLIPSWRFFQTVDASPRIEYRLCQGAVCDEWTESYKRPQSLTVLQYIQRLFWNANWNDQLFMASCAERLVDHPTQHSIDELCHRILRRHGPHPLSGHLQFRLVFLSRRHDQLVKEIEFESQPILITECAK